MSDYGGPYEAETTDGEEYFGSYALFEDLPLGRYDVYARHPLYEEAVYPDLDLDPPGRQPPIVLEPRDGNVVTVSGDGNQVARYEFSVDDGPIEKSTAYGATVDDDDAIEGSTVVGRTTGEPDSYVFHGEIVTFDADAPVDVLLNGDSIDPATFDGSDATTITLAASDETPVNYLLEVSGTAVRSDAYGATIDGDDAVFDSLLTGTLREERDSYRLPPESTVREIRTDGDVRIWIDGTETSLEDVLERVS